VVFIIEAMKKIYFKLLGLVLMSIAYPLYADDYDHIATDIFWNQLYEGGGWSLYCGFRFEQDGSLPDGYNIGIDHVYDTGQIMDHLQCDNRTQCYTKNKDIFVSMESDLHNLYPSLTDLTVYRSNRKFGDVEGEDWRFDNCDFEWKSGVVEPRPISRGNIARAIFYMNKKYNLPISSSLMEKLKIWNKEDLPSEQEKVRNNRIEKIQGQRNPYIDNPSLVDAINAR
jgi:deoxyribonuclease I